ncbi:hypothetical protein MN608_09260 [Microdochium nivale]|nr:hypothetical protein MN608_09260 [Microdochium nivale]
MNKTKEAVKNFVSRTGQHDTEVHEQVKPAVTHENVVKTHHEEVNTAVDREIHHDHYHHTVQPVKDKQILPEDHRHQVAGVEHREIDERDHSRTKQAVAAEAAKFKDERVVQPTVHTQSAAPTIQGEHHHHHIHETVQPVIQRETIQPTVVHTTIPIHETHHKKAEHHGTTALPAISMDEFKSKGGAFGHETKPHEHHYRYEGEPTEGGKIATGARGGLVGAAAGAGAGRRRRHHKRTASNSSYSSSDFDDTDNKSYSTAHGTTTGHTSTVPGTGIGGAGAMAGTSAGMNAVPRSEKSVVHAGGPAHDAAGHPVGGVHKKASLLDKINPLKDSDGDGKKGFMK